MLVVTPLHVAETLRLVSAFTDLVLTVNVPLVFPAATVMLDGTVPTEAVPLVNWITIPPDGAAALSLGPLR